MAYKLHHGDCLEVMRAMPDNSIDTVITDPPYGLEFMGKDWDHGVPGVPFWTEALRVAKPGAMLLAFGGTRTYHRLTCAIEDAGWEIRDCLMWVYGSGFPKSHDIGKAIDKAAGAEREVHGTKRPENRVAYRDTGALRCDMCGKSRNGTSCNCALPAPATPAAQLWDGWGTALKPSVEPIVMAMKPYESTFAHNAITHGVAGLNVDGARVPVDGDEPEYYKVDKNPSNANGNVYGFANYDKLSKRGGGNATGRWPANLLLDHEAARLLDAASGERPSGGKPPGTYEHSGKSGGIMGDTVPRTQTKNYEASTGGASRYFMRFHYSGKASKRERTCDGTVENKHPTVKPLSVCQYLAKLTRTPTGGVVLDPFMGSGSIGIGSLLEGREFIGIELARESFDTAAARIAYHARTLQPSLLEAAD